MEYKLNKFKTKFLVVFLLLSASVTGIYSQSGWIAQTSGASTTRFECTRFSGQTGYAVGGTFGRQEIYKTTNGGTNWVNQLDQAGYNFFSLEIGFTNTNYVWVVGGHGIIYNTTNGGTTWTSQANFGDNLYSVSFYDLSRGWAVGNVTSQGALVVRTTNGGASWFAQPNTIFKNLNFVFFESQVEGFVTGDEGSLYKTFDGGISWFSLPTGVTEQLRSICFTDTSNGWAAGEGGRILNTTNGGSSWTIQTSGTEHDFNSVRFANTSTGWVTGNDGAILITTNGGANWTPEASNVSTELFSMFFIDSNTGWVVGEDGVILKTMTGGVIGIRPTGNVVPTGFRLYNNYPNPFNPSTKIKFDISKTSDAKIVIYDILGKEIETIVNESLKPGNYEVEWNASNFSSGVYFYKLVAGSFTDVQKMVLVK